MRRACIPFHWPFALRSSISKYLRLLALSRQQTELMQSDLSG
jgi:hypothetical protein